MARVCARQDPPWRGQAAARHRGLRLPPPSQTVTACAAAATQAELQPYRWWTPRRWPLPPCPRQMRRRFRQAKSPHRVQRHQTKRHCPGTRVLRHAQTPFAQAILQHRAHVLAVMGSPCFRACRLRPPHRHRHQHQHQHRHQRQLRQRLGPVLCSSAFAVPPSHVPHCCACECAQRGGWLATRHACAIPRRTGTGRRGCRGGAHWQMATVQGSGVCPSPGGEARHPPPLPAAATSAYNRGPWRCTAARQG